MGGDALTPKVGSRGGFPFSLPSARALLARAASMLAAELAKYVREMPEAFIPQAALRRVALNEGAAR